MQAVAGVGKTLWFTTVHPDGSPTALYRVDCEKLELEQTGLPSGGRALAVDGDKFWIASGDNQIVRGDAKSATPWGVELDFDVVGLAVLSGDRLAVLAGAEVVIVDRKKKKTVSQTLELPETGTALAADPTGNWLAVGTQRGNVSVFQAEEQEQFLLSEMEKLHEGAVTAMLFEPEELRILSAGMDQKLLLTHARGSLEPEDRGRGGTHDDKVTALVHVPGERFVSGSADKSLKTWTLSGGARPATLSDGVAAVVDVALVEIHQRTHIVAACADNTLRFWLLDAAGKFGQATHKLHDAYAAAAHELQQNDAPRRQAALESLAGYNDAKSLELLDKQIDADADHHLRRQATELISQSDHPQAAALLEPRLRHQDEAVRLAALAGLRKQLGDESLKPLKLALAAGKTDVGIAAVEALAQLAKQDDLAYAELLTALNSKHSGVRLAVIPALESLHKKDSPEPSLVALKSNQADVRGTALIRLFQRNMLGDALVRSTLRRHLEDTDAGVRRQAFLVTLLSQNKLATAIRTRDKEIHRQLFELETHTLKPGKDKQAKEPPKTRKAKVNLSDAELEPLLQAMASRTLDTCLNGARCLALLEDSRAFGLLLQLSREPDTDTRVRVCRALGNLGDERGVNRLRTMLQDDDSSVRDAAFSALAALRDKQPLEAAAAGLNADQQDVRERGLQLLVKQIKAKPPKSLEDESVQLLQRALNASHHGVRGEAFKAALNLNIAGNADGTLRFLLTSVQTDIRREVLSELMAQVKEPWAWDLLLEMLRDPVESLRREAFEFAVKKTKGRDLAPLSAALDSPHADTRKLAVAELVKKHTDEAQQMLAGVLDDEDSDVRQSALSALISADAQEAITAALGSQHFDVRVRAATARAKHGDQAALPILLELATAEEPEHDDARAIWKKLVVNALEGIAELGDPEAFQQVRPLLESKHGGIRKAAAHALAWCAREDTAIPLRAALQHEDDHVKNQAAFGLAIQGDPLSLPAASAESAIDDWSRLAAAACLGSIGEDQLLSLLDTEDPALRHAALIVLLLRDWLDHDGTPARGIACLSSLHPRVRLKAAEAVQRFHDEAALGEFIVGLFNDRLEETPWAIEAATVREFAALALLGSPHTRARSLLLLRYINPDQKDHPQAAWDLHWRNHAARFSTELKPLTTAAKKRKLPKPSLDEAEICRLTFGTFVGLIREQDGTNRQAARVRETALRRLRELAESETAYREAARPVLVQALGDPHQAVRFLAFEQLQLLEVEPTVLAGEAIEAGHKDLGVEGLKLLTKGAKAAESKKILEQCMLSRGDALAIEAAKLLAVQTNLVTVAAKALDAGNADVRRQGVIWLTDAYDEQDKAKKELRAALKSRHEAVRMAAADNLATKNDAAAFDALVTRLGEPEKKRQTSAMTALRKLNDPRVPDALIDRVTDDPTGTALVRDLLIESGRFRLTDSVDRLLGMMDKPDWRSAAGGAVLMISGFNQAIEDPQDERPDSSWEQEQHPRHTDVLARLMSKWLELGDKSQLDKLLPQARWARGNEVDEVLSLMASHPDEVLRRGVVYAIGWRLRKRGGPSESIIAQLEHRDAVTKFLAAEGLALAKRNEGLTVLLAAVDLMSELHYRQRAVFALGELADERALEVLLKLADDDEHALQEDAIEAIGHLASSDQAERIFSLLSSFSKGRPSPTGGGFIQAGLAARAVRGLRWFNTNAGWKLIREFAEDNDCPYQFVAVDMLGYNDDSATRELLLRLIEKSRDEDIAECAMTSARRLYGDDLEPDYAFLRCEGLPASEDEVNIRLRQVLDRVCESGDAEQIFGVLSAVSEDWIADRLAGALLKREEPPLPAAVAALEQPSPQCVAAAAQVIGVVGKKDATTAKAVDAALVRMREQYVKLCDEETTKHWLRWNHRLQELGECVVRLIWAAGRLGAAEKTLIEILTANAGDAKFRDQRRAAINALTLSKPKAAVLDALQSAATDRDPDIRQWAAAAISRIDVKRGGAIAEELLSDRVAFARVADTEVDLTTAIKTGAEHAHYQPVVLPEIVSRDDHATLGKVAANHDLPESTRMGAVEALAKLATPTAENELVKIGKSDKFDEELRKSAWRGLRRSKRAREKTKA